MLLQGQLDRASERRRQLDALRATGDGMDAPLVGEPVAVDAGGNDVDTIGEGAHGKGGDDASGDGPDLLPAAAERDQAGRLQVEVELATVAGTEQHHGRAWRRHTGAEHRELR